MYSGWCQAGLFGTDATLRFGLAVALLQFVIHSALAVTVACHFFTFFRSTRWGRVPWSVVPTPSRHPKGERSPP